MPVVRTGFETEIDISAASHSSLIRAKAINRDGRKLGWSDAVDGNGHQFSAIELEDSEIIVYDIDSAATGDSSSSTPMETANRLLSTSARSTPTGAASISMIPQPSVLEIWVTGIALFVFSLI